MHCYDNVCCCLQPSRCLFIANLADATTRDDLAAFAQSYGRLDSTRVIRDRETQQPKGFGFIYMKTIDDAWQVSTRAASSTRAQEKLELYFWSWDARNWLFLNFCANFMCISYITTLWTIFWPQFHGICTETAICALPVKILTPPLNSATAVSYNMWLFPWSAVICNLH